MPTHLRSVALFLCLVLATSCGWGAFPADSSPVVEPDFELNVALTPPGSLDPALATSGPASTVLKLVCDTLLSSDPATGTPKAALAESWVLDSDARKVTFQIRSGVTMHNGRELVAADFVYSLSRLAHPDTGSPHHFLLDKVSGYAEIRSGHEPQLAGVTAPDENTLEIALSEPFAEFPAVMTTIPAGVPVPREALEASAEEYAARPVCTGPYRWESAGNQGARLIRHETYYSANGAHQDGGRGGAAFINLRFVDSQESAFALVDSAQAHVGPVSPRDLAEARAVEGRVSSGTNGHLTYIGLPVGRTPYDDPELRRGLAQALDRKEILSGLLGGSRALPKGFLPESAGSGAAESRCPEVITETADPGATQRARDRAVTAFPDSIAISFNAGGGHETWLRVVADRWSRDLDITAELRPYEWDPYLEYLADPGADGPFRLAWAVRYPSPEAILAPLFASASLDNLTGYSSPEFDAKLMQARATAGAAERQRLYADAASLLCRDLPIIPVWFGLNHFAFSSELTSSGSVRVDVFGDPVLRDLGPG